MMRTSLLIGAFATTALGANFMFTAENPIHTGGQTLWKTHCRVPSLASESNAALAKSNGNAAVNPSDITYSASGDKYVFAAENDVIGRELFQLEGSSVSVFRDLKLGAESSNPKAMTMLDDDIRFVLLADSDADGETRLHYHDGDQDGNTLKRWQHPSALDYKQSSKIRKITDRVVFDALDENDKHILVASPDINCPTDLTGVACTSPFSLPLQPLYDGFIGGADVSPRSPQHMMEFQGGLFFTATLTVGGADAGRHPCYLASTLAIECWQLNTAGSSVDDQTDADLDGFVLYPTSSTPKICFSATAGSGWDLYCFRPNQGVYKALELPACGANPVVGLNWFYRPTSTSTQSGTAKSLALSFECASTDDVQFMVNKGPNYLNTLSTTTDWDLITMHGPCADSAFTNSEGGTCDTMAVSNQFSSTGDCSTTDHNGDNGYDKCCKCSSTPPADNLPARTWVKAPRSIQRHSTGMTFYAEASGTDGVELYTSMGRGDKPHENQLSLDVNEGANSGIDLADHGEISSSGACALFRCDFKAVDESVQADVLCTAWSTSSYTGVIEPVPGFHNDAMGFIGSSLNQLKGSGPGFQGFLTDGSPIAARDPKNFIPVYIPGSACVTDISQLACENFNSATDFEAKNVGLSKVRFTNNLPVGNELLVIGSGPWDLEKTITENGLISSGCIYQQTHSLDYPTSTYYGPAVNPGITCDQDPIKPCDASGPGEGRMRVDFTMAHLVNSLDENGDLTIYYHRIAPNPILGNNIVVLWMAENACKIKVEVEFECKGGDCVEVTTIVCASFAGIKTDNLGYMRIECKVPAGWDISTSSSTSYHLANGGYPQQTVTAADSGSYFPTAVGSYTGTYTAGAPMWEFETSAVVPENGGSITGAISITGSVKAVSDWVDVQEIYSAPYNLTRSSKVLDPLDMPVMVLFHTDDTLHTAYSDVNPKFAACGATCDGSVFLAKQKVEYGEITNPVHAYIRVVAKVAAPNHYFKDLKVTAIDHSTGNCQNAAAPASGTCSDHLRKKCYVGNDVTNDIVNIEAPSPNHAGPNGDYPQATILCENFMADSKSDAAPDVAAGDTLVLSLQWRLRKTTTSGKAMLLQEADGVDPADQTVSIKVGVSFGSTETNVEVLGGENAAGEDSDENKTTYIIIAVVVIAVALCIAAVVAAYLCLRNKNAEQDTQYSPAKYEVAAVYDISAPKGQQLSGSAFNDV